MSKIPCELVQDLLPNYIEKLTSEKSTELIREHLQTCEDCRKVYASMREPDRETGPEKAGEHAEIDFLKKNRKRNRRIVAACILGGFILSAALLFARFFLIGGENDGLMIYCETEVDGRHLKVSGGVIDSLNVVRKLHFREKDGVVTLIPVTVFASPFHRGEFRAEYDAPEEIREVRMGGKTLWKKTEKISISPALSEEVLKSYEKWDSKTEIEKLASSTFPGYVTKEFASWEEMTEYLGFAPENPFESSDEFVKSNWTGADIPSPMNGVHARITFTGSRSGEILELSIETGYTVGDVRVMVTVYPIEYNIPYEYVIKDEVLFDDVMPVTGVVVESDTDRLWPPEEGEIRAEYDSDNRWEAADLRYISDGCRYWVRLIAQKGSDELPGAEEAVRGLLSK